MSTVKESYDSLSKQGKVSVCIMGLALFNIVLSALIFSKKSVSLHVFITLILSAIIYGLFFIYFSNCMIKGECEFGAWYIVLGNFIPQVVALYHIYKHPKLF